MTFYDDFDTDVLWCFLSRKGVPKYVMYKFSVAGIGPIRISPESHLHQCPPNLSESSGLHPHRCTECSSLQSRIFFSEPHIGKVKNSGSPKHNPSKPHPCNMPQAKRKLRCNLRKAALQKLHCNVRFSAVRTSFVPKAALQQTKSCTATSKKLRCTGKWTLSCRFPANFKPPCLGTHVLGLAEKHGGLANRGLGYLSTIVHDWL